ncbi:ethanolamine utilization cobalamin adenosyltransferase [Dethiosulfatibacter aminovorans DSM 17477]|uniref:Ethanolamine utilization cobalamin adenosyltransferase n=1 Tax=Dethiosulfatibacter aminovorans DSM 17477 TaxID=1121476 RepID=A0A1M6DQG5_9FIRM|nr:hypothetical protein [Dethiosulfatibacter aminovorans]SHI75403.1 ethanolamine utilization cobalamin adenosyltransferase [Dethiosulfatibacter aminovorans DSM 17477]
MKVMTEANLRKRFNDGEKRKIIIDSETLITPAAKDFASENKISIETANEVEYEIEEMPVSRGCSSEYISIETGETFDEKPEDMTHLYGMNIVKKTNKQIVFRGKLDSLQAKIIESQLVAYRGKHEKLIDDLEEMLQFTREMLSAEVKGTPLGEAYIMGMYAEKIRYVSHNIKAVYGIPHPTPNYKMGELCISLNTLRTVIRETELIAAEAFDMEDGNSRIDIVKGLNRLSSCSYILLCRVLAGYYKN